MNRENQRIWISKRLLKEAMLRLLQKKDLERISVTELCTEAGINRATFYRHYDIPRDVLTEIEKEIIAGFVDRHTFPQNTVEAKDYIHSVCAYMDANADLLRLIMQNDSNDELTQLVLDIFMLGIQDLMHQVGTPHGINTEELRFISGFGASGSVYMVRQWLLGKIPKTAQEIADFICGLIFTTDWYALAKQLGINNIK